MARLMSDLLSYSRVVHDDSDSSEAECETVLETALAQNKELINKATAVITHIRFLPWPAIGRSLFNYSKSW